MTITAGNFVLSNFISDGDGTLSFAPTLIFPLFSSTGDFVFNWNGVDAEGNNAGTAPVTVSDGGTGDSWSMTVTLVSLSSNGGEWLYSGNTQLVGGDIDGAGFTKTGAGAASLQAFIQSLHVSAPNGGPDSFQISFSLTDTTTSSGANWVQNFDTTAAPCFAPGTRIAVPNGERAVDDLRIGDLVMTATGVAKKVKWLGRRSYTAAQVAANPHVRSVLVRKDAIAPGMPHRDMTLSPMHALLIDDCFVPAVSLINGVTILRNDELAPVSYIHIELDGHDVVFAEGQPAETFVDDASRQMFDNADEYYAIYGADQGIVSFSAPRLEEGLQLEALRRRIAARAGLPAPAASTGKLRGHVERLEDGVMEGWVVDTASSTPVELEVLVDGEVVATAIANRYRVDLDHAGIAGGQGGFTVALPASVTSLRQVAVRRTTDSARIVVPQVAMAD